MLKRLKWFCLGVFFIGSKPYLGAGNFVFLPSDSQISKENKPTFVTAPTYTQSHKKSKPTISIVQPSEENKPKIAISQSEHEEAPDINPAEPSNVDSKKHLFWPSALVYHFAFGEKLPTMLKDFCNMQDVNVVLSERLLGSEKTVHRSFKDSHPVDIWNQLTRSYGLLWFYDGNVLYVYDTTESETKTLQVHPDQVDALISVVDQLGFYSSRIGLKTFKEGGIVITSGPPKFTQILEDLTKNMRFYKQDVADEIDVHVFLLKHAWALDKTIGSAQVPGVATLLQEILGSNQKSKDSGFNKPIDTKVAHKVQAIGGLLSPSNDKDNTSNKNGTSEQEEAEKNVVVPQGGIITTDGRQNAIIVKDLRKNMPLYEALIAKLDVPLELIEIQAAIVNVDRAMGLGLGTNVLQLKGTNHEIQIQPLKKEVKDSSGSLKGIVNGREFLTTIQSLESSSLTKLLARPSVITMDNITAVMDQSQTYYLPITSEKSSDMYSVTGSTTLKVTPHIIRDTHGCNQIQLLLDIKDETVVPGTAEKDKSSVHSSSILTQAVVYEGQSVLVGGYFNESFKKDEAGIPLLKDLPILGYAFKHKNKNKQVSERLFLITPTIIQLSAGQPNAYEDFFETPPSFFKPSERFSPKQEGDNEDVDTPFISSMNDAPDDA
ncbi:MAG: hypothetical protein LBE99_02445 [Puniceicoccales bacterium]|jgi:type III secretion protein C|nr:hypothetical protein [Puniceicoccales bacterium]